MSDREFLEVAADVAGIKLAWPAGRELNDLSPRNTADWNAWNPLKDDGNAFRLAVDLRLDVCTTGTCIYVSRGSVSVKELIGEDGRHAAARRGIVRAAAEIGKAA